MATKNKTLPEGSKATFKAYSDPAESGDLAEGAILTINSYNSEEELYNVEDEDGNTDSVYLEEMIPEQKAAKKKVAKKAAKKKVAKKKVAKKKVATETRNLDSAPELPKFKKTVSLRKALEEHGGDALKAAPALAEREAFTEFTLGGLLAFIKRGNLHSTIMTTVDGEEVPRYESGLKGFNAYASEELGVKARKADWLVQIYERFSQVTTEAKLAKIGWTTLRELTATGLDISEDNVDEWLTTARDSTIAELHEAVTKSINEHGGESHGNRQTTKQVAYKLVVHEDQGQVWEEAFEKARETLGEEATNSECNHYILTEWMSLHA